MSLFAVACSTPAIKLTHATDRVITQINLRGVRYSRPKYQATDPSDEDAKGNHELSCMSPLELWGSILVSSQTQNLLNCLNHLQEDAHFIYVANAQPVLKYDSTEKVKNACLARYLPEIPLPREIYFLGLQANQKDQDVYAMSFNTKTESSHKVDFKFPLMSELKKPQDLELWLMTSVFALFEDEQQIKASLVPDLVANACFKSDARFEDKKNAKIAPVYWP